MMRKSITTVIGLWSTPCAPAAALKNAFKKRPDTEILTNPITGSTSPETAKETEAARLLTAGEKPIRFFQDMGYYTYSKIPKSFYEKITNILIIKDPKTILVQSPHPMHENTETAYEVEYQRQYEFYQHLRRLNTHSIIIDAEDLHTNPKMILSRLCQFSGISFHPSMCENASLFEMANAPSAASLGTWNKIEKCQSYYYQLKKFKLNNLASDTSNQVVTAFSHSKKTYSNDMRMLKRKFLNGSDTCFFFDMDGTLCDNEALVARAHQDTIVHISNKYQIDLSAPTLDSIKSISWGASIDHVIKTITSQYSHLEPYTEEYRKFALARFSTLKEQAAGNYFIQPSVNMLRYVLEKNYKVCIVSGSTRDEILKTLTKLSLHERVPYIGASDCVQKKPNPEPYLLAKKMLSVPQDAFCVAFEDSPSGTLSAHNAGLFVVGLAQNDEDLFRFGADIVVSSLVECQNILQEITSEKTFQKECKV